MEYFKNNNIVVFGMGRSGTNALSEKLALEYYKDTHLYIKEPFSINEYNISFKDKKFSFFPITNYQSVKLRNKILNKIARHNRFIMNVSSNSLTIDTLKLLKKLNCKFILIERKNYVERFLSHFLAIQNKNHHGPSINYAKDTFNIGLEVLNEYKQSYIKYLKLLKKIQFEEKYIYEDCEFKTNTYKSNYNLPKEQYFKNIIIIKKFLDNMVKSQ
jgi:hypothetical protein